MKKGLILILTIGVFSIINTEMGVVGILPLVSENYGVTVAAAGLLVSMFALVVAVSGPTLVSMFALVVAVSGPTMPLFFSGVNRKKAMILVLSVFTVCNVISAFAVNFPVVLITRVIPAFFQPVYVSMAMSVAGSSVPEKDAPKAVSKVMMGVSAGMVLGVPIVSYIANLRGCQCSGPNRYDHCSAGSSGKRKAVLRVSAECAQREQDVAVYLRSYVLERIRIRCIQLSFRIHGDSDTAFGRADQYTSSCIWSFQYAGKPDRGADAEQPSTGICCHIPVPSWGGVCGAFRCSLLSGVCLPERRPISISTGLPQQRRRRLILPMVCSLHLRIWEQRWGLPYVVSSCQEWVLSTLFWEESSSSPALLC